MEGDVPSEEDRSVLDIVFSPSSHASDVSSSKLSNHERTILDALMSPLSSFTSNSSDCNQEKDPKSVKGTLPPSFIFNCETPKNTLQKLYKRCMSEESSSVLSSPVSKVSISQLQAEENICKSANVSSAPSSTTENKGFRPKKRVAVILSSSDNENECDGETSTTGNVCNKSCEDAETGKPTGDQIKIKNTRCIIIPDLDEYGDCGKLSTGDEIKIKNTHCTVIPDLDEHGDGTDYSSKVNFEKTRFPRQLDYDKWAKQKEKARRKKKEEQEKEKLNSGTHLIDQESAKHNAWVNWMCKKKNDELKKKVQELNARRMEEIEKDNKEKVAKQKFEEWVKKKKEQTNKQGSKTDEEKKAERSKKLSRQCKKWEEWYAQNKDKNIPKSFTHISYPKPAWVNPVPWSHPEPSEYLSSCADLDY